MAQLLKSWVVKDFLGKVDCFVSSDTDSVLAGENWLSSVGRALDDASVEAILCSPASVMRPWINFEAGAGWIRRIPIVPICHSGLTPRNLPLPLTVLQAVLASDPTGLERLYSTIANAHQSHVPQARFSEMASQVRIFELEYQSKKLQGTTHEADRQRLALDRMLDQLKKPSKWGWRSVERLSFKGGVSESEAADLLRGLLEVEFSKGSSGRLIARLKSK